MPRRRLVDRLTETDEDRLGAEIREWADTVRGSFRIADAPDRQRVKLAGAVRRITIRPVKGFEGMRLLLYDGTGEVSVLFLGRRCRLTRRLGTSARLTWAIQQPPQRERHRSVDRLEARGRTGSPRSPMRP